MSIASVHAGGDSANAEVFSWTLHQAMCAEQCGWEGTQAAAKSVAEEEAAAHNLAAHGIPRPAPARGWRWYCDVPGCEWRIFSWSSEAIVTEGRAQHESDHEAAWAAGIGPHRGHTLIDTDGGMGECSCRQWVPLS